MTRVLLSLLLFVVSAIASARADMPLQAGEKLAYKVSWAVVPGAGEIKVEAQRDPAAPEARLLVTSTTATRRLARVLLPFNAYADAVFDLKTRRLISLHELSTQREKRSEHTVAFDYATRQARYTNGAETGPRALTIPEGDPTDLIMGLLQTRSWNLKVGEKRDALVLFDDDFYELTIHCTRTERVRTPLGTFNALVLEPRMEKTAPKGMFRRGSKVRVWIAQDERRLPVKFEVEFKIGTGTATLESYTPPAGAPAEPATAPAATDAQNSRP